MEGILAMPGGAKGRVVCGAGREQHLPGYYLAHQTLYTHQGAQKPKERKMGWEGRTERICKGRCGNLKGKPYTT